MMLAKGSPESKAIRNRRHERETKCKTQEYRTEGQQYSGGVVFIGCSKLMHNSYAFGCHSVFVLTPEQVTRQKPESHGAPEFEATAAACTRRRAPLQSFGGMGQPLQE